jgi:hypothetical protein
MREVLRKIPGSWWLGLALFGTLAVYWPGLHGGFLFDDYPNIVENKGVQPQHLAFSELARAALSSPSSSLKRPLASLSFAANYLLSGLNPFWMKLTNVVIHLLNGALVYLLSIKLLNASERSTSSRTGQQTHRIAAIIAAAWLLLPINLTAVLYVVQRMESLANVFVLLGLLGYCHGRQLMLEGRERTGLLLCSFSIASGTALGLAAKETAVLLPLYAVLIESFTFRFRRTESRADWRIAGLFFIVLVLPLTIGLVWQLPLILRPSTWASRDFTLVERLLSEARIVVDYIGWTLLPIPRFLSFYHDDFEISRSLFAPWTTALSLATLAVLAIAALALRRRHPLAALGIALFIGAQTLTATVLPLELIYEHRNYFASFGLLLVLIPPLCSSTASLPLARRTLLLGLLLLWTTQTATTAYAWGNPLRLSYEMAGRAADSPRAQYDLGRTYVALSKYDPDSPFTKMAYAPLERAAALPHSSILPEQALIYMNARMGRTVEDRWWDSLIEKLRARRPDAQDEGALGALTKCAIDQLCPLPPQRMVDAFLAALNHPAPRPRTLAAYSDYAWNVLQDRTLAEQLAADAVAAAPRESVYRITLIRMLIVQGKSVEAESQLAALSRLNVGGQLDNELRALETMLPKQ